jgi:hypothetical protein
MNSHVKIGAKLPEFYELGLPTLPGVHFKFLLCEPKRVANLYEGPDKGIYY